MRVRGKSRRRHVWTVPVGRERAGALVSRGARRVVGGQREAAQCWPSASARCCPSTHSRRFSRITRTDAGRHVGDGLRRAVADLCRALGGGGPARRVNAIRRPHGGRVVRRTPVWQAVRYSTERWSRTRRRRALPFLSTDTTRSSRSEIYRAPPHHVDPRATAAGTPRKRAPTSVRWCWSRAFEHSL